jgi:hypothetical protein
MRNNFLKEVSGLLNALFVVHFQAVTRGEPCREGLPPGDIYVHGILVIVFLRDWLHHPAAWFLSAPRYDTLHVTLWAGACVDVSYPAIVPQACSTTGSVHENRAEEAKGQG